MIILSGENTSASAKRLNQICDEFKAKGSQINIFDQSELTLGKLRQELSPADLFGTTSLIVVRSLLSGSKSKSKDKLIEYLKKENPSNLLLYETKTVHPSTLKQFKGSISETFKIDANVFKFLEKITPGNTQNILKEYVDLKQKGVEPEFIFAMLNRQVRLLLQLKTNPKLLKIPAFSQRALGFQAQKFSLGNLLDMHQSLYQIEVGVKSGRSPLDLNELLLHFLEQL